MARIWNRLLEQLVLVRLGQELGTDSDLAQAIAGGIDFALGTLSRFLG
jgi:hypothetical protein